MKKRLFILSLVFLFGCEKKEEKKEKEYPVKIESVIQRDTPIFLKSFGELRSSLSVDIKAQVSGVLTQVLFEDGKIVEEGDLLMTIDPRIYEANVKEVQGRIDEKKAKLKFALDFAETYGSLVGQSYVARLDYAQGLQNVDMCKAAIECDMAALKRAELDLEYTQIRAPFKGYAGLRKFDEGNYVEALDPEPLVSIRRVTPISVNFYIPSRYLAEIQEKQAKEPLYIEAVLPGDPSHPLKGTVFVIDNYVNYNTGMIFLKATIPNLDERGWPGDFVRVFLRLKEVKDAILVPTSAIILGEAGYFVFVVDENTMRVSMRMIGIERNDVEPFTIVHWGLKEKEKVVSDGQLNLREGSKVYIPEPQNL